MKNKLHIIGCSHSTDYDCELDKWWGKFLADSLQLDLFHTHGQSGKNVEFILLDIYDRMLNGKISKDDVVEFPAYIKESKAWSFKVLCESNSPK